MRTEQLIEVLAADETRERPLEAVLATAVAAGIAVAAAGFLGMLGTRPDLGSALTDAGILLKQALPVLLAVSAFGAAVRLARPGAELGGWRLSLAAVPALALAAVAVEAARLPVDVWDAALWGKNQLACLVLVPATSAPVALAGLWALRRGAPTRPALAGAAVGLLASGAGAGLYAWHCTDDSPFFYATWYSVGIALVTGVCALAGRRWLRW